MARGKNKWERRSKKYGKLAKGQMKTQRWMQHMVNSINKRTLKVKDEDNGAHRKQ